jgi:hypothetical protein
MSVVLQPGDEDEYACFAVFDKDTKKLLYSKYNFNYAQYATDFSLSYENTHVKKRLLFFDFLKRNASDLRYAFTVKEELKQYFNTDDSEYMNQMQQYFDNYGYVLWDFNYISVGTFVNFTTILENEFSFINYDYETQISSILEFMYYDELDNIYTRYNFNFDAYSQGLNVFGSKLCIFSDFLLRMKFLSGNAGSFIGYNNIPENFRQYFDKSNNVGLRKYLSDYGIFSPYRNIKKNPSNINYEEYIKIINDKYAPLNIDSDVDAKIYFYKYGQFQQDIIPFNPSVTGKIDELRKSVCEVFQSQTKCSGFLFRGISQYDVVDGVQQIYLTSCYHLISNSKNQETIYAICYLNEYKDANNIYYPPQEVKLMFRVLGYDKFTDMMVCLYEPSLGYNLVNYSEETYYITKRLQIITFDTGMLSNYVGQEVMTLSSLGNITDSTFMTGKVIDSSFGSTFNDEFTLSSPSSILTDIRLSQGTSGSPLFITTKNGSDIEYKCVGMIVAKIGDDLQYSMAVNGNIFNAVLSQTQSIWYYYKRLFGIDNIDKIRFYTKDVFPKKWLGCACSYYNPCSPFIKKHPELIRLNYTGGVLVTDFIFGFNTNSKKFIYDPIDLGSQDAIQINTPLLTTQLYKRFLVSGNVPILLKSVELFDLINGNYDNFLLGKYTGQSTLDILTYGFVQYATVSNSLLYTNPVSRKFFKIIVTYFYFDGGQWVETSEPIGGNDTSWYNIYEDRVTKNKFRQHKFEYPTILANYLEPFGLYNSDTKLTGNGDWLLSNKGKGRKNTVTMLSTAIDSTCVMHPYGWCYTHNEPHVCNFLQNKFCTTHNKYCQVDSVYSSINNMKW